MSNKVVYVKAKFKAIGKTEMVKVPTGEKKKGFLGGETDVTREEEKWVQTGFSQCEVDGVRFAQDVEQAITQLNDQGYEVVTTINIISGNFDGKFKDKIDNSFGYGYGYSFTEGVIIITRKV